MSSCEWGHQIKIDSCPSCQIKKVNAYQTGNTMQTNNQLRQVKDISEYHAEPNAQYIVDDSKHPIPGYIALDSERMHIHDLKRWISNGELYVKSTAPTIRAVWMRHPTVLGLKLIELDDVEKLNGSDWQVVNVEVMSDV